MDRPNRRLQIATLSLFAGLSPLTAQPGPIEGSTSVRVIAPIQFTPPAVSALPPLQTPLNTVVPVSPIATFTATNFRPQPPTVTNLPPLAEVSGPVRPIGVPPSGGYRVVPVADSAPASDTNPVLQNQPLLKTPAKTTGKETASSQGRNRVELTQSLKLTPPEVPDTSPDINAPTSPAKPKIIPVQAVSEVRPQVVTQPPLPWQIPEEQRQPLIFAKRPPIPAPINTPPVVLPIRRPASEPEKLPPEEFPALSQTTSSGVSTWVPRGAVSPKLPTNPVKPVGGSPLEFVEQLPPVKLNTPPTSGNDKPAEPEQVRPPVNLPIPEIRTLPVNLATALQLADANPIDIQIAAKQTELAAVQLDLAKAAVLPNISLGLDYLRHDGAIQNFQGLILESNRSSLMGGIGINAVFAVTDAIYAPLAARQELKARQAFQQATGNDVALSITEAYFGLQQAKGDFAAAMDFVHEANELVRRTEALAEGLVPPVEATRARVELARRRQAALLFRERWVTASIELTRLLRMDSSVLLDPIEAPGMVVRLIDEFTTTDELVPVALRTRPELQGHQAVVQATLERIKQEKIRPLVPSILLRSVSTNPSGTLGFGAFGGGSGDRIGDTKTRFDYDAQIIWEIQNLGRGNRARVNERRAEHEIAMLELFRIQDRIAAEVCLAHTQSRMASERLKLAEPALKDALDSFRKNLEGMSQTRRAGNLITLIVRPAEVVAALQALSVAASDYQAAVADLNRAQFRLWRALGNPPPSAIAKFSLATPMGTVEK